MFISVTLVKTNIQETNLSITVTLVKTNMQERNFSTTITRVGLTKTSI